MVCLESVRVFKKRITVLTLRTFNAFSPFQGISIKCILKMAFTVQRLKAKENCVFGVFIVFENAVHRLKL